MLKILDRTFLSNLISDLCEKKEVVDDIPISELDMAERLVKLLNGSLDDAIDFLLEGNHLVVVLKSIKSILSDAGI